MVDRPMDSLPKRKHAFIKPQPELDSFSFRIYILKPTLLLKFTDSYDANYIQ